MKSAYLEGLLIVDAAELLGREQSPGRLTPPENRAQCHLSASLMQKWPLRSSETSFLTKSRLLYWMRFIECTPGRNSLGEAKTTSLVRQTKKRLQAVYTV